MAVGFVAHASAHPSQRLPVLAERVVATSQPIAAQTGLEALREGGTAVDGALAAAIALTVVEPTGNGIGGDLFALVWDGRQAVGLNASGRSPAGLDADRLLGREAMPDLGWDTVTVPGAPSGWAALSERFGRLGLERLAEPAAGLADSGWPVSPVVAAAWGLAEQRYAGMEGLAEAFLPGGRAPRAGERFASPEQAASLRAIAATGGEALYRGELGERLVEAARREGGALRGDDLAAHRPEWVAPLALPYAGGEVVELPPNGQGVAALWQLAALERVEASLDGEVDVVHAQVEAAKVALAEAEAEIADPAWMRLGIGGLLDEARLTRLAGRVAVDAAGDPGYAGPPGGGTVLVVAGDAEGRLCALIQSNYALFGSGVVVPGTGISLHNRGHGFSTRPGHPNAVAGGKRPFHTILPAMALREGRPLAAFGVMGGHLQAQGHAQLLRRRLVAGEGPQSAVDAPRWRVDGGRRVALEHGLAPVAEGLRARGHEVTVAPPGLTAATLGFGGAQYVERGPSCWVAAGDPRKDGHPAGW